MTAAAEEHSDDHPAIDDVNELPANKLSAIATICRRIAAGTGTPLAPINGDCSANRMGNRLSRLPAWTLTLSSSCCRVPDVLQLVMIFVIAVPLRVAEDAPRRNRSRLALRNQSLKAGRQKINGLARGPFVAFPPQNSGDDISSINRSEKALFLNDFFSGLVHP